LLIMLAAQIGWKADLKLPVPREAAEAMVDSLAAAYYEAKFTCYPAVATLKGVPGYDNRLSTYSQRSTFGLLARIRGIGQRLSAMDEDSLSIGKWIEHKALLADMGAQRLLLEDREVWRRWPTLYVDACADGIALLCLLSDVRATDGDVAARLSMIPLVVKHARRNLTNPSELHCRIASERLDAVIGMLGDLQRPPSALKIDPALLQKSIDALRGFKAFVDSLTPYADARFALTYDDFMILLDTRNMISDPPEDMRAYALKVLDEVNTRLAELPSAASVGGPDRVSPIGGDDLSAETDSAWNFLMGNELVSVPGGPYGGRGPGLVLLEMPGFAGHLYGDVLYLEPGPDAEPGYVTRLYVAPEPAEPGATPSGVILSEAFPGRHLQAVVATRSPSQVRRMHEDMFATNGWALYSQGLMAENGFGGEAAARAALERKRFHAAGTVAAINLLLGEFTLEEAAGFMVDETGVSGEHAHRLAAQYAVEPEQPISYITGERQIVRIRDEAIRILGDDFDLTAFHESLLACGRLPLYLIRHDVVSVAVGRQ
jgi:hypothetical protein